MKNSSKHLLTVAMMGTLLGVAWIITACQDLRASAGRTIGPLEARLLRGGEVTAVSDRECEVQYDCMDSLETCPDRTEFGKADCESHEVVVKDESAKGEMCTKKKQGQDCYETTPNVPCSTRYLCLWDSTNNMCYKSTSINGSFRAAADCSLTAPPPPPGG